MKTLSLASKNVVGMQKSLLISLTNSLIGLLVMHAGIQSIKCAPSHVSSTSFTYRDCICFNCMKYFISDLFLDTVEKICLLSIYGIVASDYDSQSCRCD